MNPQQIVEQITKEIENYIPGMSIDCVLMGYKEGRMHVLVLKFVNSDHWALPGGFIKRDEDMEFAARRVLHGRTGVDISYLQQLRAFGSVERRQRNKFNSPIDYLPFDQKFKDFFNERFISMAYLALVNPDSIQPVPDAFSEVCEWRPVDEVPSPLIYDHAEMIEYAREYISQQIKYQPMGLSLMPEKFTMNELRGLYEAVLGVELDRANFQKKILKLGILNRHEKQMTGAANKAPYLYSFNEEKYKATLERGLGFLS